MDKELIAYLDERFNAIDKRFEQIDKRFEQVDKRFEQVDKRFEQVDKRFEQLEGAIRANGVEIEGLRGDIKQVAEGVAATNQRIDAFQVQVDERFDEMRQLFNTSHSNLHSRVSALEGRRLKKVERPT